MRHQVALRIQGSLKTRENLASPGHCEALSIDVGRLPETVVANRGFARRTEFLDQLPVREQQRVPSAMQVLSINLNGSRYVQELMAPTCIASSAKGLGQGIDLWRH